MSATGYTKIRLKRLDATDNGVFGHLEMPGFDCATLERHDTLINPGVYKVIVDQSPRLGYRCPHLIVPDRDTKAGGDAGIRIHIANYESQLRGCVAVGSRRNGFAVENSRTTFEAMMKNWPIGEVEIEVV